MRRHAFLASAADRDAFLGFALKVLLYQPPSSLLRTVPANPAEGVTEVRVSIFLPRANLDPTSCVPGRADSVDCVCSALQNETVMRMRVHAFIRVPSKGLGGHLYNAMEGAAACMCSTAMRGSWRQPWLLVTKGPDSWCL